MALNRACIGKTYPAAGTAITREAIANYARACNETNPCYFDSATPGGIVAPPLFAAVATWLPLLTATTDPELHADLIRLLHTGQEMELLGPIQPGDQITATATISAIADAPGGESLTVALDATNRAGLLVNRTRFTALIRGRRSLESRTSLEQSDDRGAPLAIAVQTIDRDQTVRYAEASGDRNPIHVDPAVARMAGLPGIIVHGLCTAAFAARAIIEQVGGNDPTRLRTIALGFARPVLPGDTLTTSIWDGSDSPAGHSFGFATVNQDRLVVIRDGTAQIAA